MSDGDKERWNNALNANVNNTKIASPYNFIAPSDKVIETPWATADEEEHRSKDGKPSHEKPYPWAYSGELEIQLEFQDEFLIGGANTTKDDKIVRQATYGEKNLVIPGASIRGLLRSVLEIAASSRISHINRDARFGYRDWKQGAILGDRWLNTVYEDGNPSNIKRIKSGYLVPPVADALNLKKPITKGWQIIPCEFARVEIDEAYQVMKKDSHSSSSDVYKELQNLGANLLKTYSCHIGKRQTHQKGAKWNQANPVDLETHKHPINKESTENGRFVPVGDDPSGNNTSWVFLYGENPENVFDLPEHVIMNMISVYKNGTGQKQALEFWSEVNTKTIHKIPVIYVQHDDCNINNGRLEIENEFPDPDKFFIGFSRAVKAPHIYSVGEIGHNSGAQFSSERKGTLDFVEALFGMIDDTVENDSKKMAVAWKTRAFFRHAEQAEQNQKLVSENSLQSIVAASPKPSFAHYYLNNPEGKIGWSEEGNFLAGVKRYPVRSSPSKLKLSSNGNTKIESSLEFLGKTAVEKGTTENGKAVNTKTLFNAKLKVNNLHPLELGGLVWALGFATLKDRKNDDRYFHTIGRAKAQGYGKVSLRVLPKRSKLRKNIDENHMGKEVLMLELDQLSSDFEAWVANQHGVESFDDLNHIRELRAMADPEIGDVLAQKSRLDYPNDGGDTLKGYKNIKNSSEGLWRYPRERYEKD